VAKNAAATGAVANAMQKGTFVFALVSGEEWSKVLTGGGVSVIGSMASPAPEPPASSTPPAPNFCRGCGKELTITAWRLRKVHEARTLAGTVLRVQRQAGGLPSMGGSSPDEAEP